MTNGTCLLKKIKDRVGKRSSSYETCLKSEFLDEAGFFFADFRVYNPGYISLLRMKMSRGSRNP